MPPVSAPFVSIRIGTSAGQGDPASIANWCECQALVPWDKRPPWRGFAGPTAIHRSGHTVKHNSVNGGLSGGDFRLIMSSESDWILAANLNGQPWVSTGQLDGQSTGPSTAEQIRTFQGSLDQVALGFWSSMQNSPLFLLVASDPSQDPPVDHALQVWMIGSSSGTTVSQSIPNSSVSSAAGHVASDQSLHVHSIDQEQGLWVLHRDPNEPWDPDTGTCLPPADRLRLRDPALARGRWRRRRTAADHDQRHGRDARTALKLSHTRGIVGGAAGFEPGGLPGIDPARRHGGIHRGRHPILRPDLERDLASRRQRGDRSTSGYSAMTSTTLPVTKMATRPRSSSTSRRSRCKRIRPNPLELVPAMEGIPSRMATSRAISLLASRIL